MNAKKAKTLRQLVRAQTQGMPWVAYEGGRHKTDLEAGTPRRLTDGCTRHWYQKLKRIANRRQEV